MRRVGPHSFTEIYFAGCNPSFVETSDGYVMIDSPQQPINAVRWRERMEELRNHLAKIDVMENCTSGAMINNRLRGGMLP